MDGVLNVYKPTGMTSFDVVYETRKLCNTKKVGHTGTLDPEASGVLPICIGKATKIADYIMNDYKIYKTELRLGITTDSYDREGKILSETEINFDEETVIDVINSFLGENYQVPPMYSAIKVNGQKLYNLARQGIEIEREARKVYFYEIEIININLPYVEFLVKCSKGTYIRSLCYDIGNKLGCGGTMWNLERVATGNFKLNDAIRLDVLTQENVSEYIIPISEALSKYETIHIETKYEKLLLNGVVVNNQSILKNIDLEKLYKVYLGEDRFIGLGRRDEYGFKIIKMLI
jgi:tRNA pseudouridine55 synthase